jgi:RNA recognition motif-containing protein
MEFSSELVDSIKYSQLVNLNLILF